MYFSPPSASRAASVERIWKASAGAASRPTHYICHALPAPTAELYSTLSTYDFPRERPSRKDWATWQQFWRQYCLPGDSLPRGLGKWRHPTHRIWEWFHDAASDTVFRREGGEYRPHRPGDGSPGTLTQAQQVYSPTAVLAADLPHTCLPASILPVDSGRFTLLPCGPGCTTQWTQCWTPLGKMTNQ
jgi:hypothetical protein